MKFSLEYGQAEGGGAWNHSLNSLSIQSSPMKFTYTAVSTLINCFKVVAIAPTSSIYEPLTSARRDVVEEPLESTSAGTCKWKDDGYERGHREDTLHNYSFIPRLLWGGKMDWYQLLMHAAISGY